MHLHSSFSSYALSHTLHPKFYQNLGLLFRCCFCFLFFFCNTEHVLQIDAGVYLFFLYYNEAKLTASSRKPNWCGRLGDSVRSLGTHPDIIIPVRLQVREVQTGVMHTTGQWHPFFAGKLLGLHTIGHRRQRCTVLQLCWLPAKPQRFSPYVHDKGTGCWEVEGCCNDKQKCMLHRNIKVL
jgi:hypothetical protein